MSSRTYGNLIWTNHALERLEQRRFSQELAWSAFRYPDNVLKGKLPGSYEYQKRYQQSLITLIAKQNDKHEWIVLSCWIDPPLAQTQDAKKRHLWQQYRQASWWGKWWITIRRSLGF
jgi:hypothetical protein